MATPYYPDHVPGATKLGRLLKTTRKIVTYSDSTSFAVFSNGENSCLLPGYYIDHMRRFLWREDAIRLVLNRKNELDIPEMVEDNIAMVLWYMDGVFDRLALESRQEGSMDAPLRSDVFDNYLVIEYWVRRHEPKNITKFRSESTRNLDRTSVDECNWNSYEYTLGGIWTGSRMRYTLTKAYMTASTAQKLVAAMKTFYDPPIAEDGDFGYTFTEHIAETLQVTENDGVGEGSAGATGKDTGTDGSQGDNVVEDVGQAANVGRGSGRRGKRGARGGRGRGTVRSLSRIPSDESMES